MIRGGNDSSETIVKLLLRHYTRIHILEGKFRPGPQPILLFCCCGIIPHLLASGSLLASTALGVTKYTHFNRAILAFIFQCIFIVIWIIILRLILGPAANAIAAAKLPADVNILIIYLNLCIVAPALIVHNAFWLRWPLTLPTPPGTPPPDQTA